jgi:hypothetical protein
MIVVVDLEGGRAEVRQSVAALKAAPSTSHLPVIGVFSEALPEAERNSQIEGVTLLVSEAAVLTHLPQFLEQALQLD